MQLADTLPADHDGIGLRPLAVTDAAAYAAGTRDAAVQRYAHLPLPEYTPEIVRDLATGEFAAGIASGELAVLTVADSVDDTFLGSLVLFDIGAEHAEVGFWLAPHGRGRGIATRALRAGALVGSELGLNRLVARTVVDNAASRRTLQAAGFTPDGEPRHSVTPSGAEALTQHYRLTLH